MKRIKKKPVQILLTGDYWHSDFRQLLHDDSVLTTLIPHHDVSPAKIEQCECSLVVVAQSRRNQVDQDLLDDLMSHSPHIPVVLLCGSWCEGEMRSGSPIPGVLRVYWHQWRGRLFQFLNQLTSCKVATWNLPRTFSSSDGILNDLKSPSIPFDTAWLVGISAQTPNSYSMLQDVCQAANLRSVWIENLAMEQVNVLKPQLVMLDGNSLSPYFMDRIRKAKTMFRDSRLMATLNFPRQFEFEVGKQMGLDQVVSKPFNLRDVHLMMHECCRAA